MAFSLIYGALGIDPERELITCKIFEKDSGKEAREILRARRGEKRIKKDICLLDNWEDEG